ncbi:MAG TPA: SprT family zinc-dependent metalloprotease [bacterium]|nr:SprT family zinc-dependent metalloprotease [bacterium]HOY63684.1 SprT family zinc-dependent metalloprotease [bacterium]HPN95312.1 SprT family zinc-dependent metalloprotease [bacterium]
MPDAADGKQNRHAVQFGRERIEFSLSFSPRKSIRINVHPDRSVSVVAPVGVDVPTALERVKRRAAWIIRQRDYFERFQPMQPPRRYVSGESHLYLGRHYRLKVIRNEEESVKLIGRYINVNVPDRRDTGKIESLLNEWYKAHAETLFSRHLEQCYERVKKFSVPYPRSVRLRQLKKRWGSCSKAGAVLLNTELVKAPIHCVDYVITHELCHLKYPSHGSEFYRLLSACMPDWERRKERLEKVTQ